jgi:hypothetical protein
LFVHPARHDNVALKRAVFKMMDDTGPETFIRQQKAIMSRPDSRPSLGAIHCPTLVLVGNEDALTPVSVALTIADGIAGSKLEIVQECGHLSPMARSGNSGVERLDCLVKFIGKSTFDLVDRGAIDSIGHPNRFKQVPMHCITSEGRASRKVACETERIGMVRQAQESQANSGRNR